MQNAEEPLKNGVSVVLGGIVSGGQMANVPSDERGVRRKEFLGVLECVFLGS